MTDTQSGYAGQQEPTSGSSDFNAHAFLIQQMQGRMATVELVRVAAVTNAGGIAPVGFVDVVPAVAQIDGAGNATPHGTIHNVPYVRVQGGSNAVVLDPQVGDMGLALFAARDISAVKASKAPASPGSRRRFDWADAIYVGGCLNGTPTQYVAFASGGITIGTPNALSISAGSVNITASGAVAISSGGLTHNGTNISSTHKHPDPQGRHDRNAGLNTLLLDRTAWDLVVDAHGNIAVASEPYSLAQDAASAIRLFAGELWYDTTKGVPYFASILGKTPSIQFMRTQFVAAALTVPNVVAAKCFISSIQGRNVTGQVQVTNRAGKTSFAAFGTGG